MNCPECTQPVERSHRRGLLDKLRSLGGHRPYRCFKCNRRFFLRDDPPTAKLASSTSETTASPAQPRHSEIRLEVDREKPTAQITIEADSHLELESLLTALNDAVVRHESVAPEKS